MLHEWQYAHNYDISLLSALNLFSHEEYTYVITEVDGNELLLFVGSGKSGVMVGYGCPRNQSCLSPSHIDMRGAISEIRR